MPCLKGRQDAAHDLDGPPDDLSVSQQRRVPSVSVGRQFSNNFNRFANVIDDSQVRKFSGSVRQAKLGVEMHAFICRVG